MNIYTLRIWFDQIKMFVIYFALLVSIGFVIIVIKYKKYFLDLLGKCLEIDQTVEHRHQSFEQ